MWRHFFGAAFVLVPGLLALQAWHFLRLSATPPEERLRGVPRCTAAGLGRLKPGARAVVEGRVVPEAPGAPLPAVTVRRRKRQRGARTLEAWRERASTPALELETEEGRVRLTAGGYALLFPREAPSKAPDSRSLREGDLVCALVTLEERGRYPRARAEWLYAAPLSHYLSEVPGDVRLLRGAVAALCATSALGALGWGWLARGG